MLLGTLLRIRRNVRLKQVRLHAYKGYLGYILYIINKMSMTQVNMCAHIIAGIYLVIDTAFSA